MQNILQSNQIVDFNQIMFMFHVAVAESQI